MATATIDWDDGDDSGVVEDPANPRRMSSAISDVSSSVGAATSGGKRVAGGGGSDPGAISTDDTAPDSRPNNTLSTPRPLMSGRSTTVDGVQISTNAAATAPGGGGGGGGGVKRAGGDGGDDGAAATTAADGADGGDDGEGAEEEDPDLARARAAALAIASNPNLRPEDLMRLAKPDDAQKRLVDAAQRKEKEKKKKGPLGLGGLQQHLQGNIEKAQQQLQGNIEKALQESGIQLPPALAKLQQKNQSQQQQEREREREESKSRDPGVLEKQDKQQAQERPQHPPSQIVRESGERDLRHSPSSLSGGEPSASSAGDDAGPAVAPPPPSAKKPAPQPPPVIAALGKGLVKNWKGLGGLGSAIDKMEEKENLGRATPAPSKAAAQSVPPGSSPLASPVPAPRRSVSDAASPASASSRASGSAAPKSPRSPDRVRLGSGSPLRKVTPPRIRGADVPLPDLEPPEGKARAQDRGGGAASAPASAPVPAPSPTPTKPPLPPADPEVLKSRIVGIDARGETKKPAQDAPPSAAPEEEKKKDDGRPPVRLSVVAWKRRTGLGGKISAKHAWERRRIELRGTKLAYFKMESEDEAASERSSSDGRQRLESGGSDAATPRDDPGAASDSERSGQGLGHGGVGGAGGGGGGAGKPNWWEQAAQNIAHARENLKQLADNAQNAAAAFDPKSVPVPQFRGVGGSPSDPNAPRGELDLVEERATASATHGHSGAPTPFCVSVKVKSDTPWKFCFDSQAAQMRWLAALTDVVVGNSVDCYNEGLSELRRSIAAVSSAGGEGPLRQMAEAAAAETHRQVGNITAATLAGAAGIAQPLVYLAPPGGSADSRGLWKMDGYQVTSMRGMGGMDMDELEEEEESEDEEDELEAEAKAAIVATPNVVSSSLLSTYVPSFLLPQSLLTLESEPKWLLDGDNLNLVIAAMNFALLFCRASSTTREGFWMALTLVNLLIWLGVRKEEPPRVSSAQLEKAAAKGKKKRKRKVASATSSAPSRSAEKRKERPKKPLAGTTCVRVKETTEKPVDKAGRRICPWQALPGSEFQVRSHGYLRTKRKVPAPGELYKLVAVDAFESDSRYPNMADRVQLPRPQFNDEGSKDWHSPDVFVISLSIPTEAPKMGRPTEDGVGYTVTMYYVMREETRAILRRINSPEYDPSSNHVTDDDARQKSIVNAVRLWDEWCRRAPTDPKFFARFKFLPMGNNLKEIGMPGWIIKYNGKPVLIKRSGTTGFLYDHPDKNAMEFDISIHPFPYLAKQATAYMKDNYLKDMLASFSFIIEGREDSELPEVLIGEGVQLCYPDPQYAVKGEDWFAGKGPQLVLEDVVEDRAVQEGAKEEKKSNDEVVNDRVVKPGE